MSYTNKRTGEVLSDHEYSRRYGEIKQRYMKLYQGGRGIPGDIKVPSIPGELAKGAAETVAGVPARFIASTLEVPGIVKSGGVTSQRTYDLPGIQPFKSYQSAAETTQKKIVEGKEPLWKGAAPFVEVPLAGLETAALAKGAVGAAKGVAGVVTKKVQARAFKNVLKAVQSQPMTKSQKIAAFKKAGAPGGVEQKGFLKTIKKAANASDERAAKSVMGVIKPKQNATKQIESVRNGITSISQGEIRPILQANNNPIKNIDDFVGQVNSVQPSYPWIKRDATLAGNFDDIKKSAIDSVLAAEDNLTGQYNGRIGWDDTIKKLYGDQFFSNDRVTRTATRDGVYQIRRMWNKFIASQAPEGDRFLKLLEKEHNMFNAIDNIAEKSYAQFGTNVFQRVWKKIPMIARYGITAAAGSYAGSRFFGRGGGGE